MHIVKKTGYVILAKKSAAPSKITHESHNWKIWRATVTITTCYYCASMNGRILAADAPELEKFQFIPTANALPSGLRQSLRELQQVKALMV